MRRWDRAGCVIEHMQEEGDLLSLRPANDGGSPFRQLVCVCIPVGGREFSRKYSLSEATLDMLVDMRQQVRLSQQKQREITCHSTCLFLT